MIKTFDDFGYYKEITMSEFTNLRDQTLLSFNKDEISMFRDLKFDIDGYVNDKPIYLGSSILVYKLEDEWYMVSLGRKKWKCDQLEGLKKCLNDL